MASWVARVLLSVACALAIAGLGAASAGARTSLSSGSVDPCRLVTAADIQSVTGVAVTVDRSSAARGQCSYQGPQRFQIFSGSIEDYSTRVNARRAFEKISQPTSAGLVHERVSGIGEDAYYFVGTRSS
jgi:hypothetical protein